MLKHYDIINNLSDSDKIRILSDINSLSDKKFKTLGIPEVNIAQAERFIADEYPSPEALANTWDTALVGNIADELVKKALAENVGFLKLPSPKIKINPYGFALSEDPHLASSMSKEYLKAAQSAELSAGLRDFGLRGDELEWIDECPDERFIYEYIVDPYKETADGIDCSAILTEQDVSDESYSSVNSRLTDLAVNGEIAKGAAVICPRVSAKKNVSHLLRGGLFFEGSAVALESAYARYKQLKKEIDSGNATVEALNLEIADGKAISTEILDEAVDKLLSFVFSAKRKPNFVSASENAELSLRATRESVVLLKNERSALPLKKDSSVCLIGDIAMIGDDMGNSLASECIKYLSKQGFDVRYARGYDINTDRSEELIADAAMLAKNADTVLLFLGLDEKRAKNARKLQKISIPANQQELLDKLGSINSRIVAILPSDITADVAIPEKCAAIMMAPFGTKRSAQVIFEALTGILNPSGKLANTVYLNSDRKYTKYKTRRSRDGIKVGPFVGYRYYDISGEDVGFPFGHGIGYTNFSYSELSVNNGTVRFTVKNEGKTAGTETVQIYVGKNGSSVIRPKKELCGFMRAELGAGEKKTFEIPLTVPKIYCPKAKAFIEEDGSYTVYVGASVSDIRLTQNINVNGYAVNADNKKLSDYIHSESNIISDNFKLEAKFKTMKRSLFNFIAGAFAIILAIVLKLFCVFAEVEHGFFDFFAVILGIAGIVFFIVEAARRHRLHKEEKNALDKLNKEMFAGAEQIPVYAADKMFVEEFDTAEADIVHETEEHMEGADAEYFANIDKELSFSSAADDFEVFAAERGCRIRSNEIKKIFAALSASRLVVVNGMSDGDFKTLMLLLSSYFETSLYLDRANEAYVSAENLLFKLDVTGNKIKTNAGNAFDAAKTQTEKIHLAALTNVVGAALPLYFTPYVNYVKNPLGRYSITMLNDKNIETSYVVPRNLWFILNLADGETPDSLPDFVSEVATVNTFALEECAPSDRHTSVRKFSYYQMDYLTERTAAKFSMDEELWKKVDRLEEYVNAHKEFHIGNKMWLCLEKYAYVYMACGGDKLAALDEAVAAKLMTPVIEALRGNVSREEKSLAETVETIFGEDKADASKKMIEACADIQA